VVDTVRIGAVVICLCFSYCAPAGSNENRPRSWFLRIAEEDRFVAKQWHKLIHHQTTSNKVDDLWRAAVAQFPATVTSLVAGTLSVAVVVLD